LIDGSVLAPDPVTLNDFGPLMHCLLPGQLLLAVLLGHGVRRHFLLVGGPSVCYRVRVRALTAWREGSESRRRRWQVQFRSRCRLRQLGSRLESRPGDGFFEAIEWEIGVFAKRAGKQCLKLG
jgi:hypothetical protein